jgi:hypothetical protein
VGQRLSTMASQPKKKPVSTQITVANSLPGGEEGITASGSRLQPFGDEDYWGDLPPPTPEESLIDLPPMPDLRTPDQITRRERIRDLRVAKFEERKAELESKRAEKEMRERAVVNRPVADPSTALVQVESAIRKRPRPLIRGPSSPSTKGRPITRTTRKSIRVARPIPRPSSGGRGERTSRVAPPRPSRNGAGAIPSSRPTMTSSRFRSPTPTVGEVTPPLPPRPPIRLRSLPTSAGFVSFPRRARWSSRPGPFPVS